MSMWKTDQILLGHKGDVGRLIEVDVSEILNSEPDASFALMVTRPTESDVYLPESALDGNIYKWPLTRQDTAIAGYGQAELIAYRGEKRIYSCIVRTWIRESLADTDPGEDPKAPWVETVLEARDQTLEAAADVAGKYPVILECTERSETAAESAEASDTHATEMEQRAEEILAEAEELLEDAHNEVFLGLRIVDGKLCCVIKKS